MFARASRGEMGPIPEKESDFIELKEKLLHTIDNSMGLLSLTERKNLVLVREQIRLMNKHNEREVYRNVFVTLNKFSSPGSPEFRRIRSEILLDLNEYRQKKSPEGKNLPFPLDIQLFSALRNYKEALKRRRGRLSLSEKAATETIEGLILRITEANREEILRKLLIVQPELHGSDEYQRLKNDIQVIVESSKKPAPEEKKSSPITPEHVVHLREPKLVEPLADSITLSQITGDLKGEEQGEVTVLRTPLEKEPTPSLKRKPTAREKARITSILRKHRTPSVSTEVNPSIPPEEGIIPSEHTPEGVFDFSGSLDAPAPLPQERIPKTLYTPIEHDLPEEIFEPEQEDNNTVSPVTAPLAAKPEDTIFDLSTLPKTAEDASFDSTEIPPPLGEEIWEDLRNETNFPETQPLAAASTGDIEAKKITPIETTIEIDVLPDGSKIISRDRKDGGMQLHITGGQYDRYITGRARNGRFDHSRDASVLYSGSNNFVISCNGTVDENFYPHGNCKIQATLFGPAKQTFTFEGHMEHGFPTKGTLKIAGTTGYTGLVDKDFKPLEVSPPLQSAEITPAEGADTNAEISQTEKSEETLILLENFVAETRNLLQNSQNPSNLLYELEALNHFEYILRTPEEYGDGTPTARLEIFAKYVMDIENNVEENIREGKRFDNSFQRLLSQFRGTLEGHFKHTLETFIVSDETAPPEYYNMVQPPEIFPEAALGGEEDTLHIIDPLEMQPTSAGAGAFRKEAPTVKASAHETGPDDIEFNDELINIIDITENSSEVTRKEDQKLTAEEKEIVAAVRVIAQEDTPILEKIDHIEAIIDRFPKTRARSVPFIVFKREIEELFQNFERPVAKTKEKPAQRNAEKEYTGLRFEIHTIIQEFLTRDGEEALSPAEKDTLSNLYPLLDKSDSSEFNVLRELYQFFVQQKERQHTPQFDFFLQRLQTILSEKLTPAKEPKFTAELNDEESSKDQLVVKERRLEALMRDIREALQRAPSDIDIDDSLLQFDDAKNLGDIDTALKIGSEILRVIKEETRKKEDILISLRRDINEALVDVPNVDMNVVGTKMRESKIAQDNGNINEAIQKTTELLEFIRQTQQLKKLTEEINAVLTQHSKFLDRDKVLDAADEVTDLQEQGKMTEALEKAAELLESIKNRKEHLTPPPLDLAPYAIDDDEIPDPHEDHDDENDDIEDFADIFEGNVRRFIEGNEMNETEKRSLRHFYTIIRQIPNPRERLDKINDWLNILHLQEKGKSESFLNTLTGLDHLVASAYRDMGLSPISKGEEMKTVGLVDQREKLQKPEQEDLLEKAYKFIGHYISDPKILAPLVNSTRIRERFMQSEPERSLLLRIRKVLEAERKQREDEMKQQQYLLIMEEPEPEKVPLLFGRKAAIERNKERERLQEKAKNDPNFRYWQALESAMKTLNAVR